MQCRKELAEKLCNCAPYFYGVKKLLSNPIRFTKSRDDLPKCNCYQSCNADNFVVASENIEEA
uniref:Uncharacterized protein n=1 Tax=Timema poppense TaxID=170557 RepID=A0A7R9DMJ6_TIMPO|nr:unnamed protein product [Timema poppensis]